MRITVFFLIFDDKIKAKSDKEKQQRMKQLPSSDKLIERLCIICNHNIRAKSRNMLTKFLTFHQYLIDPLFKLCKSKLDKFYGMTEILLIILTNKKNKEIVQLFDDKYRKLFADIILNDIIGAKKQPSAYTKQSFGIYFTRVKTQEFMDVFFSEIERMMKRNPADTIKTCVVIFENIKNLGSGEIHSQLAPLLIAELKHKESERREIGLNAWKLYTLHISDSSDLETIIKLLKKEASTSSAKSEDRSLFIHCFEYLHKNCIDTLSNDAYQQISNLIIDAMIAILNKESNENVRELILGIINKIVNTLKNLQLPIPGALNKMLTTCLQGKLYGNKSVAATVEILVNVLDGKKNDELINEMVKSKEVWRFLNKCIVSAKSNPKKDGKDGLAAILAVLYLCDENEKLFEQHKKNIIGILNEYKIKSFFNHSGYIWSDNYDVSVLRVKIIEKLLVKSNKGFYIQQYDALNDQSNFKGVWETLLNCTLTMDYRVRRYACNVIKSVNDLNLRISVSKKKTGTFSCLMVNMLQKYVGDLLAGNACYMHPDKVKSGELGRYEDIPLPIEFSDCLKAIAGNAPSKDSLIYILYLSHYPWFNTQSLRAKQQNVEVWNDIMAQWSGKPKYGSLTRNKKTGKKGKGKGKQKRKYEEKKQEDDDDVKKEQDAKKLHEMLVDVIHNNKQLEDLIRTDLTRIKYPVAQTAIMDTIACVFKLSPRLITENERILHTIDSALNSSNDILDFTEKEKQICYTPEGVLCTFEEEHKSRSEAEKDKKGKGKRQRHRAKPTNLGGPVKGKGGKNKGKKGKKQAPKQEKLLVKTVTEKGTKRLLTEEEELELERKRIAVKTGEAEKEKQAMIEQQSLVRKKLETVRFRLYSVFRLFKAFIAINTRDFAGYLALKYIKHILPFSESELLRDNIADGMNVILQSFSDPIKKQSKTFAMLMIKHHIFKEKLFESTAVRNLITNTMRKLQEDSDIPDIKIFVGGINTRKRRQKPTSIAARGKSFILCIWSFFFCV